MSWLPKRDKLDPYLIAIKRSFDTIEEMVHGVVSS